MYTKSDIRKVGLVFSGGGGKGAYEIGVWRALNEFGITQNIGAVSGTSVGALNAALFAQSNLQQAEAIWRTISPETIITTHSVYQRYAESITQIFSLLGKADLPYRIEEWLRKYLSNQGCFSKEGLSRLIRQNIDINRIRSFPGPVYATAYNLTRRRLEYFDIRQTQTLDDLEYQLLASASLPVIFGETYMGGYRYLDGGLPAIGDNTPVRPLCDLGFSILIVVHLSREEPVNRNLFPGCRIVEIMPQDDLGGLVTGTMNFLPEQAQQNMLRGYEDACRILAPLYELHETVARSNRAISSIVQTNQKYRYPLQELDKQYSQDAEAADAILSQLEGRYGI